MNDYLDSLVMRSLGVVEAIQPRPVSLFEPLPGLATLPSGLPSEISQERVAPSAPALDVALHPAAGPPARTIGAERPGPATSAGPERPVTQPAFDPLATHLPRLGSPAPVQPVQAAEVTPRPSRRGEAAEVEATAQTERVAGPIIVEWIVAPPTPLPAGVAATRGQAPARAAASAEPGSRMPSPGVVAQPHVKRVTDATVPNQVQPGVRPEPAPTVQVTIGRIEVRAAPLAPAPMKQAPRPPMSLDEYLRQRRGGTP